MFFVNSAQESHREFGNQPLGPTTEEVWMTPNQSEQESLEPDGIFLSLSSRKPYESQGRLHPDTYLFL